MIFIILILFLINSMESTEVNSEVPVDQCVQDVKSHFPEYTNRFPDPIIIHVCKIAWMWIEESQKSIPHPYNLPLTQDQLEYFFSVTRCKGLQCLCDFWDECRREETEMRKEANLANSILKDILKNATKIRGRFSGHFDGILTLERSKRQSDGDGNENMDKFGRVIRKEIRAMTDDERFRFFRALNILKSEKVDNLTKYDIMIIWHRPEYAPEAHFGAAFLPFHREFLKDLEFALRLVDPTVSIPYWDSTLDSPLPNPAHSILWSHEFLGNGDGEVVDGPFGNWTTLPDTVLPDLSQNAKIVRAVGRHPFGSLFKDGDVELILGRQAYRNLVFCVDPYFELIHGALHVYVGGHMIRIRISPNDPTFFLIHAWVDLLWELWRESKQNLLEREREYVNNNETCNNFSNADAQMRPFIGRIQDGLSNRYTNEFYIYQARPKCSTENSSCQGSPHLYCDVENERCISKIRPNGNCTGFDGKDICYKSQCRNGICVATAGSHEVTNISEIRQTLSTQENAPSTQATTVNMRDNESTTSADPTASTDRNI